MLFSQQRAGVMLPSVPSSFCSPPCLHQTTVPLQTSTPATTRQLVFIRRSRSISPSTTKHHQTSSSISTKFILFICFAAASQSYFRKTVINSFLFQSSVSIPRSFFTKLHAPEQILYPFASYRMRECLHCVFEFLS